VELAGGLVEEFYAKDYALPPELVKKSTGNLEVVFVAKEKSVAGGVYDLRLMR
jgi:hypothetical protein